MHQITFILASIYAGHTYPEQRVRVAKDAFSRYYSRSRMAKRAFRVGDKVVYPHHGAATVESLQDREMEGATRKYYILRLSYGDLTLMVPMDGADEVGLRGVVPKDEIEDVFQILKSRKQAPSPSNWSRRFKNHVEKLRSGDIYQVAEVVKNLTLRDKDKGLSAGEKRMLSKARQILVSELTFALNSNEDKAEAMLDEVLGLS
jgi:CarD family transcriptional regulator